MVAFRRDGVRDDQRVVDEDIRTLLLVIALQGRDPNDLYASRPLAAFINERLQPDTLDAPREDEPHG